MVTLPWGCPCAFLCYLAKVSPCPQHSNVRQLFIHDHHPSPLPPCSMDVSSLFPLPSGAMRPFFSSLSLSLHRHSPLMFLLLPPNYFPTLKEAILFSLYLTDVGQKRNERGGEKKLAGTNHLEVLDPSLLCHVCHQHKRGPGSLLFCLNTLSLHSSLSLLSHSNLFSSTLSGPCHILVPRWPTASPHNTFKSRDSCLPGVHRRPVWPRPLHRSIRLIVAIIILAITLNNRIQVPIIRLTIQTQRPCIMTRESITITS